MKRIGTWSGVAALAAVAFLSISSVSAVDVEKKWRLSLQAGGYNTADSVPSDAANVLTVLDFDDELLAVLPDPRSDDAAFGEFGLMPATRAMLAVQYAFSKIFVLEGAVGYQRGDVGDIEVQHASPLQVEVRGRDQFDWNARRIRAGVMEQIPIQLTAIARFRPRANFNPFLGAGVGYTIVGFTIDDELDALSSRIDQVRGQFVPLGATGQFGTPGPEQDLTGARIDARDTFEWHVASGAEYSFGRRWAVFADIRYTFASREFELTFNGADGIGVSVPNTIVRNGEPISNPAGFGPVQISDTGIVDFGTIKPLDNSVPQAEWSSYCTATPELCFFDTADLDGQLDPGYYYVQGGRIKYGGWSAAVGVRFTF